jgi:hypothetical protein
MREAGGQNKNRGWMIEDEEVMLNGMKIFHIEVTEAKYMLWEDIAKVCLSLLYVRPGYHLHPGALP